MSSPFGVGSPIDDPSVYALTELIGTGILVKTGADTWDTVTITGTANEITVTDGDGLLGNPIISLPSAITLTGKTMTGGTYLGINRIVLGTSTALSGILANYQSLTDDNSPNSSMRIRRVSDSSIGNTLNWDKARGSSITSPTIVSTYDAIGVLTGYGYDGANYQPAAAIAFVVDPTPALNDMPGLIRFSTTPDGSTTLVERMVIDNQGRVTVGATGTFTGNSFRVSKNLTGGVGAWGVISDGYVQSDVTTQANAFLAQINTASSVFTLSSAYYYHAYQGTFGSGSLVSNQFGFYASGTLTGATNNYGFYGNIASGTNRYNLYMGGTAQNVLVGNTRIGSTSVPTNALDVTGAMTVSSTAGIGGSLQTGTSLYFSGNVGGAAASRVINADVTFTSSVTTSANFMRANPSVENAVFTLPTLRCYNASFNTKGASATLTELIGFYVDSSMVGGTSNFGFYSNIPSGTNNYNIYVLGTAQNVIAGDVRIGSTVAPTVALDVTGAVKISSTITTLGGATFHTTSSALTNGSGAALGTLTNAPSAGDPTKWIGINDNGTTRYIPAW